MWRNNDVHIMSSVSRGWWRNNGHTNPLIIRKVTILKAGIDTSNAGEQRIICPRNMLHLCTIIFQLIYRMKSSHYDQVLISVTGFNGEGLVMHQSRGCSTLTGNREHGKGVYEIKYEHPRIETAPMPTLTFLCASDGKYTELYKMSQSI